MLKDNDTYSTIPVSDRALAKKFYGETLGLPVERDTEGGVMYRSGGTRLFVYPSGYKAGGHTQMSWFVSDIKVEVAGLKAKGIQSSITTCPAYRWWTRSRRAVPACRPPGSKTPTETCWA